MYIIILCYINIHRYYCTRRAISAYKGLVGPKDFGAKIL